jgi:hypothetical protein
MRLNRWKQLQEGQQVHLRNGYLVRGGLQEIAFDNLIVIEVEEMQGTPLLKPTQN